jgi:phosphatidyl-myo-inositol dimannoside synthase
MSFLGAALTGSVDEADLPGVYRCAHVFSLVSDSGPGRGEGIPLSPLEAMSCGAPIIVGNDDGSQEAVAENRNGFVVSPHDAQAHADALLRLINAPDLAQEMGAEARKVAEEYFSFQAFVRKHRRLAEMQARSADLAPADRSVA